MTPRIRIFHLLKTLFKVCLNQLLRSQTRSKPNIQKSPLMTSVNKLSPALKWVGGSENGLNKSQKFASIKGILARILTERKLLVVTWLPPRSNSNRSTKSQSGSFHRSARKLLIFILKSGPFKLRENVKIKCRPVVTQSRQRFKISPVAKMRPAIPSRMAPKWKTSAWVATIPVTCPTKKIRIDTGAIQKARTPQVLLIIYCTLTWLL